MTLQEILASLLNPGGSQQAPNQLAMAGAPAQVGDHANPAALLQGLTAPQGQQATQQAVPPQAPQGQPMPQSAPAAPPVAAPPPSGGGIGGFLSNLLNPQDAGKNQTISWLRKQGMDEGTATMFASSKPALQQYLLKRAQGGGGATAFDQRAQAAQQYGLDPNSPDGRDFILTGNLPQARGGNAELGLQPQFGVDDQGNPALLQLGKDGKVVKSQMPPGVTLSKTPIKLDAGTEWILLDPITRQPVGRIPKDLAGAASQTAQGTAQGAAAFDLPRVEQNANQILDTLDKMKNHPGREGSTGFFQGMLPSRTSDQVDFQSLVDQTKGQTFLQAFQSLKGGGAITDIEGAKATNAISRLGNQRLSDQDYLQAITDLEDVIKTGVARAQHQAGGGVAPSAVQPSAPQSSATSTPSSDAPPPSYTGKNWKYMSPEARKLWQ
ncbi:hypothetical protein [Mesorhizobium sp. URHB0026]